MPISPTELNRGKPTFEQVIALIDKALIRSNKMTQNTAMYLVVDAPYGYYSYRDQIVSSYVAAGWFKVEYFNGKSQLQDKILFHAYSVDEQAPTIPTDEGLDVQIFAPQFVNQFI